MIAQIVAQLCQSEQRFRDKVCQERLSKFIRQIQSNQPLVSDECISSCLEAIAHASTGTKDIVTVLVQCEGLIDRVILLTRHPLNQVKVTSA